MTGLLDAFDETQVKVLLHMDGADGATTFTDQSGRTWGVGGNAQIDTAQSKFGGASALFDGTGDYIFGDGAKDLSFLVNDFTIDFWARWNTIANLDTMIDCRPDAEGAYPVLYTTTTSLRYFVSSADRISGATVLQTGQWYHICLSRVAGITRLFLDGVQEGANYTDASNYLNTTNRPLVGMGYSGNAFDGWIDEFRIVVGTGVSSAFTPPTAAYANTTYLQNQRAAGRWKSYKLAIPAHNTIYTARVNGTPGSLDSVQSIPFDGGSGTITNVRAGMDMWIGSAAGLKDIGIVRIAEDATLTPFQIGAVSGVQIANDQYLTVKDNHGLWGKDSFVTDSDELQDGRYAYDPNTSLAPLVNIGPMARVLDLTGASVSTQFAAPTIYSPTGATISAYAWTFVGASASSGTTTATPSATYDAAGTYRVYLTLTDSTGAQTTVTRLVLVNPTAATVTDLQLSGDIDSGGWECRFEGLDGVDLSELYDRAPVVLYRKDYAGTATAGSQGEYDGCENVRFVGWIDGQSISVNPEFGTVSFTAHGPAWWMERITLGGVSIQDGTSPAWHHYATLNADKALYRLARWQSTLYSICDVNLSGTTDRQYTCGTQPGSLWAQLSDIAARKLLAKIWCDPLGCVWVTVPPSLLDSTDKAALEILFDCVTSDIAEEISFNAETVDTGAIVELGALTYDGTNERTIYSRAPGNKVDRFGSVDAPAAELSGSTQAEINRLAGDYLGMVNSTFPAVEFELSWCLDYPDFLRRIITLTLASSATPRGLAAWSQKRFYPVSMEYSFSAETGAESTMLTLAEETDGVDGITFLPPDAPGVDDWEFPPFSAGDFDLTPGLSGWDPPVIPPEIPPEGDCSTAPGNAFRLTWFPSKLSGIEGPLESFAYRPCTLRPASYAEGPTSVSIRCKVVGDAASNLAIYAIDAEQTPVLTGSGLAFDGTFLTANFDPGVSPLAVAGFKIVLTSGPSTDGAQAALEVSPATYVLLSDGGGTNTWSADFTNIGYGIIKWDWVTSFNENSILFNTAIQQQISYRTDSTAYIYATLFFTPSDSIGYAGLGPDNNINGTVWREGLNQPYLKYTLGLCNAIDPLTLFTSISYQRGWYPGSGTAQGLHTSVAAVYISTMNIERSIYLGDSLVYDVCP